MPLDKCSVKNGSICIVKMTYEPKTQPQKLVQVGRIVQVYLSRPSVNIPTNVGLLHSCLSLTRAWTGAQMGPWSPNGDEPGFDTHVKI